MMLKGRKTHKLRCLVALTLLILTLSAVFGVFSAAANDDLNCLRDKSSLRAVYVLEGDTLWNLVEEYYDYQGDIRAAIYEVEQINGVSNALIRQGEIIYIPYK